MFEVIEIRTGKKCLVYGVRPGDTATSAWFLIYHYEIHHWSWCEADDYKPVSNKNKRGR